jgi:hypothetical protein
MRHGEHGNDTVSGKGRVRGRIESDAVAETGIACGTEERRSGSDKDEQRKSNRKRR